MTRLHRGSPQQLRLDGDAVVAVGNFDGLHLGHQQVIAQAVSEAERRSQVARVLTFEPSPQEFFRGDSAPARLTSLRQKFQLLRHAGLDAVCALRFDASVAAMTPETFVEVVLLDALRARAVVVGEDFRFGAERAGDLALLRRLGEQRDFAVLPAQRFDLDGARVSSTRVREALAAGEMEAAAALLGRSYALCGRVIPGRRLGRELGYPTANIPLGRVLAPVSGIFAVWVHGATPARAAGVASLGTRPTVDGGGEPLLEVHLLDFEGDLYGRRVEVEFVARARDEVRFPSLDALREQMRADEAWARARLGLADTHPEQGHGHDPR